MDDKLLKEYRRFKGPLFVGYKEGDCAKVYDLEIEFSIKKCFVCNKKSDSTGIAKLCFDHYLEIYKLTDEVLRNWVKEKGISNL